MLGCLLIGLSYQIPRPKFILNLTESVPIGLYWVQDAMAIDRGSLIVFRFQDRSLIKEVVGMERDLFCVSPSGDFSVNRKLMGISKAKDSYGKRLSRIEGCQKVGLSEWVVFGYGDRSFDSRYLGTIQSRGILGKVKRIGGKNPGTKVKGKIKQ